MDPIRTAAIFAIITADSETQDRVCGSETAEDTADEWAETGLEVDDIQSYIEAECFTISAVVDLFLLGVSADDAARRIGGNTETIGYRVSNCDINARNAASILRSVGA